MQESQTAHVPIDIAEIRKRLATADGPTYWRSLEELAGTPEFREAVQREFPSLMERWGDGISRRTLLKVMGASLALMGLSGCFYKRPQGKLVPYVKAPSEIVPGQPLYFATAMPFEGYGRGVLALSREGRPIKIEGNPDHPASLGATDVFMQASILDLYDPDRARGVQMAGEAATWSGFYDVLSPRMISKRSNGEGVRLLIGRCTSPLLRRQIQEFLRMYPGARLHQYDPIRFIGGAPASVFAQPVQMLYDLSKATVIVSFAGDFLFRDPGSLNYARHFIDNRRVRADRRQMSRLYMIESTLTITGSMADNRLALRPSQIEAAARVLAQKLGVSLPTGPTTAGLPPQMGPFVDAMAAELMHPPEGGGTLVVAGESQPPAVHAIVHAINQKLGNIGKTVLYTDPVEESGGAGLRELANDLMGGKVDTLFILGGNPAYSAPADIPFADILNSFSHRMSGGQYASMTVHLSSHFDETSYRCQWHIPQSHYLESWGDVRAFDGTASIIQPLIEPLYESRSEWQFMEAAIGRPLRMGVEIVRDFWQKRAGAADFEAWWMKTLQTGLVDGTRLPHRQPPPLRADAMKPSVSPASQDEIEVTFEPDPTIWTGEFANNAWLQELPKPFIKLTWDNVILISVSLAERLGGGNGTVNDGDVVRLTYQGHTIEAPVMLLPGQADNVISLSLGYGRSRGGGVLLDEDIPRGYNAYALRTSDAPWAGGKARLELTNGVRPLAITRSHNVMSTQVRMPGFKSNLKPEAIAKPGDSPLDLAVSNRSLVRTATLNHFREHPTFVDDLEPRKEPLLSLYVGSWKYDWKLQWGMTIDMTACIGCNACVVACQAENNIAVVGKREVMRQREMHWLRIDDYFGGDPEAPSVHHQPVPCMHCENAPCEYVCPVGATTHSIEGINEMTYNRCVGTRYCSNNCPYKVRRFNFLLFSDYETPTLKLLHNPDVTVRSRGVMEKCTYCIQRIDHTRAEMEKQVLNLQEQARQAGSEDERKRLLAEADQRGREIVRKLQTACQQACPTEAIVFGNIQDPDSDVSKLKREPTNYGLLTELTTKPRTTYLAHITNPNPALSHNGQPAEDVK